MPDAYNWGRLVDSDLASSLVCDAFSLSPYVSQYGLKLYSLSSDCDECVGPDCDYSVGSDCDYSVGSDCDECMGPDCDKCVGPDWDYSVSSDCTA